MKVALLLAYTCAVLGSPLNPIHAPLDVITLDDVSLDDRRQLAILEDRYGRPKRSKGLTGSAKGSGDILGVIAGAIGKGIKRKIGEIAVASAAASGQFSKSSASTSSGNGKTYHYEHNHDYNEYAAATYDTYEHKPQFNFWNLKKSILNTLLQAVKAIKGGVIAIKGQLIKGSGKLTSATGKLISAKGDAITELGKKIATSAILVPFNKGYPSSSGHPEYVHPSAHEEIYHASPSAPELNYHTPHEYQPHSEEYQNNINGLLILKKIPAKQHYYHAEETQVQNIEPVKTGPGFGSIFSKFFSASSSFNPNKPEPFGNTAPDVSSHYHHDDSKHNEVAPSAEGHVGDDRPADIGGSAPITSYGAPFEAAPGYLNEHLDDYSVAASKNTPQAIKMNENSASKTTKPPKKSAGDYYKFVEKYKPGLPGPQSSSENIQNSLKQSFSNDVSSSLISDQNLLSNYFQDNSNEFGTGNMYTPNKNSQSTQSYSAASQSTFELPIKPANIEQSFEHNLDLPNIADFPNGFPPTIQSFNSELASYLKAPIPEGGEVATNFFQQTPTRSQTFEYPVPTPSSYLETPRQTAFFPTLESYSKEQFYKSNLRHANQQLEVSPTQQLLVPKRPFKDSQKPKLNYDVVKSVSYELGPNGPTKLT